MLRRTNCAAHTVVSLMPGPRKSTRQFQAHAHDTPERTRQTHCLLTRVARNRVGPEQARAPGAGQSALHISRSVQTLPLTALDLSALTRTVQCGENGAAKGTKQQKSHANELTRKSVL